MNFKNDINTAAMRKLAHIKESGIMDSISGGIGNLLGNEGSLNSPLMSAGAGILGGMAGKGLGIGHLGTGLGALLGGGLGYAGSNAINQQGGMQNAMDSALIGGMSGGLGANDEMDMMQSDAIIQNSQAIDQIGQLQGALMSALGLGGPQDAGMGMGMGGMDPNMMGGMDPNMMGGMDPNMGMTEGFEGNPAPKDTKTNTKDKNGLGKSASAKLQKDIHMAVLRKLASK